ncbi:MAG TPA: hypothetical protein VNM87_07910 [Candidatus Udaeobacter sp.]|nr:hypothetical protein [Candidatus Udaeobacter sp.]
MNVAELHMAERLADRKVLDPLGDPHRLGEVWRDRPVVLVFIRHFG